MISDYLVGNTQYEVKDEINRLIFSSTSDAKNILRCIENMGVEKNSSLLDIGCGPGSSTAIIREYAPDLKLTGIDYEEKFISYAKSRKLDIDFQKKNIENTWFANNEFDFVFSRFVFQHLKHSHLAMSEMLRITKKGGSIGIYENDEHLTSIYPEPRHFKKYIKAKINVRRFSGGDIFFGHKLFHFFHTNNLKNIKFTRLFRDHTYPGKSDLLKLLIWDNYKDNKMHPYCKFGLMTKYELDEYFSDISKILESQDSFVSFGGYFVCGTKP